MKKQLVVIFLLSLSFIACQRNTVIFENESQQKAPKNIILLIGDGMGMGQISAGTYRNNNTSNLERFPITGIHKPTCHDSLITDSAAGATAFACGQKTYYGAIAVDPDTLPIKTILEEAEDKNMATGLVATCRINHATPASFISHNRYRRNYEEIAADFLKTDIEYFVGGGLKFFNRREIDDRDLVNELEDKGYVVGNYLTEFVDFEKSIPTKGKVAYFTADKDPIPVAQGRDNFINTAMTGIRFLDRQNDNGFFIMIESSQIDWGGHANNAEYIITEFLEFNKLIGQVLDWAEEDGETLVVLTADHETGGFTIQPGSYLDDLKTAFTSLKHSGDFIPVFASGPGQELFSGLYENTEIYHKMKAAFDWD